MNVLFISGWQPFPPTNGSELRISHLLAGLAEHHRVTLLCTRDKVGHKEQGTPPDGVSVVSVPSRPYKSQRVRAILGLVSHMPRSLVDTYVPEFEGAIRAELRNRHYDLAIASQIGMSPYLPAIGNLPSIFEEVEIGVYRSKQAEASNAVERWRHGLTLMKLRSYLRKNVPLFSAATVVSEHEMKHLQNVVGGRYRIEVVPNGIDVGSCSTVDRRPHEMPTLVYAGAMSYYANYDAMRWFVSSIFPKIRAEIPLARLLITGDPGGRSFPASEGVEITGHVDDIRSLVASSDVSVVPIRLGGGTRLKILESMALGTPVVTTSKGMEGLEVVPNQHLLVEDDPIGFADAVLRAMRDMRLRNSLVSEALSLVARKYDWSVILPSFVRLAEDVAARKTSSTDPQKDGPAFRFRPVNPDAP